jgi:hypothetical protein
MSTIQLSWLNIIFCAIVLLVLHDCGWSDTLIKGRTWPVLNALEDGVLRAIFVL